MIYICDALCGFGKTQSAINYMNKNKDDKKFLYITPFLDEVKRVSLETGFREPVKHKGSKSLDLNNMLEHGKSVVSTHALFGAMQESTLDLICLNDYTLILDEVANVVAPYYVGEESAKAIEPWIHVEESGRVTWINENYKLNNHENFDALKKLCDLGLLYSYNKRYYMWMFPVEIFKSFKDVFVLTYMFEAQAQYYYYRYFDVEFENIYVVGAYPDINFTKDFCKYDISDYKKNITILRNDKLNFCERINPIGSSRYSFSRSWYEKNKGSKKIMDKIRNNCFNFFFNITKSKSEENMWTVFVGPREFLNEDGVVTRRWKNGELASKLCGKGYTKGFVVCNARATNDYRKKTSLAYLCNIFYNPNVSAFFRGVGIKLDEDAYALSEMIQWIFRSQIRDKKPITIYVPSRRMRQLLQDWIDEE